MNYALPNVDMKSATPTRTSTLLRDFAATVTSERVSVGEIVAALGDRGLGVLIAIFAIPNMLPSAVPFGNSVVGLFPLIFAVHLACGFDRLMLPAFVANRSLSTGTFKALVPRVATVLSWFERLLKPRLPGVTRPTLRRELARLPPPLLRHLARWPRWASRALQRAIARRRLGQHRPSRDVVAARLRRPNDIARFANEIPHLDANAPRIEPRAIDYELIAVVRRELLAHRR